MANKTNLRTMGASCASNEEREENDFYATDPNAVQLLLYKENFSNSILEPCCGQGHISETLKKYGYNVISSDIINRGYGFQFDFFDYDSFWGDIITNPPYKYAQEMIEKAIEIIPEGNKVAMLLRIQFLESEKRREFFKKYPPETVYVSPKRMQCAKNGDFEHYSNGAVMFAWFVWRKGYKGCPKIKFL